LLNLFKDRGYKDKEIMCKKDSVASTTIACGCPKQIPVPETEKWAREHVKMWQNLSGGAD